MYFFVLTILILVLIPYTIENKYSGIIYFKIFISSTIYFCLLNMDNSILTLVLTVVVFTIISILIYRLLEGKIEIKKEDNSLFNLAHEVKNPLTVCKGYLDMIDINNKKEAEEYLTIIRNEMNRSLSIMEEYLNLKRINLNKDIMDFALLLEDVKDTVGLVLNNDNTSFIIPNLDKEIIMNGDYDKLKQVLINLIKNSYEAEAKNIKATIELNNNSIVLKIIDDGKGITKEDLAKVGKMFYTTKVTGTGIGVNLSERIIELHNGTMSYESEVNKGTIVTIVLPIEYVF